MSSCPLSLSRDAARPDSRAQEQADDSPATATMRPTGSPCVGGAYRTTCRRGCRWGRALRAVNGTPGDWLTGLVSELEAATDPMRGVRALGRVLQVGAAAGFGVGATTVAVGFFDTGRAVASLLDGAVLGALLGLPLGVLAALLGYGTGAVALRLWPEIGVVGRRTVTAGVPVAGAVAAAWSLAPDGLEGRRVVMVLVTCVLATAVALRTVAWCLAPLEETSARR